MPDKAPNPQPAGSPVRSDDFRDPLQFIHAEHARIRACCEQLVRLADDLDAEGASESAASILTFLENELPRHVVDEEQDLFPLLERRALPGDRISPVIELLRMEHRDDVEFGHPLLEPLHAIATGRQPADVSWFKNYVRTFETLQRRHHALEDKVVMPLAADCFSAEDMVQLSEKMAARRGISLSG